MQARFLKWPAHPTTRCLMTFLMSCLNPVGNLTPEANTRSYKPHGELWHHRKGQEVSISYWNTQIAADGCDLILVLLEQSSTTVIWQRYLLSWYSLSTWENVFPRRDEDYFFHVLFDMEVIKLPLWQCLKLYKPLKGFSLLGSRISRRWIQWSSETVCLLSKLGSFSRL